MGKMFHSKGNKVAMLISIYFLQRFGYSKFKTDTFLRQVRKHVIGIQKNISLYPYSLNP